MVGLLSLSTLQAQNEIAALRAQADKEQAMFEAEYREVRQKCSASPGSSLTRA